MAESFIIQKDKSQKEQYDEALAQLNMLIEDETDVTANLANIMACLKYGFGFFWVGVYLVKDEELVLGPFQGPLACTRIKKGKGVCGVAWEKNQTQLVPNVDEFPGHIACSSASKSEVVVPIQDTKGNVIGVLDVDSDRLDDFDEADVEGLERIAKLIERIL
ncbi:GAF domain-containing protein [Parvicella tangerina]|uniref:Free methionine-R-sulfoxide reductase n=1 Tax=Parvicella tangerina TaxID=2829795 RepID=A0A916JJC7_9FLAO|nr:GAF domain-containing protein [Parvicella tangerina]CAG5076781.1 Free methionine-R-sulfoxide reductase [Parvicella tangerina]